MSFGYSQWCNGYRRWINGYPGTNTKKANKSPHIVCVGNESVSWNTPDGATFTNGTLPFTSNVWGGITYSNTLGSGSGRFVTVSSSGNVAYSDDNGAHWSSGTLATANNMVDVDWNGSIFAAIAFNGSTSNQVQTSSDGVSWTNQSNPTLRGWEKIRWSSDLSLWAAVASNGTTSDSIMTSTNATTWTNRSVSTARLWRALCAGSGCFVALDFNSAHYLISTNGTTWTEGSSAAAGACDVAYSPTLNLYACASASNIIQVGTPSGGSISWSSVSPATGGTWFGMHWDSLNSQFVACDTSGHVAVSSNGSTWTVHSPATDLRAVSSAF